MPYCSCIAPYGGCPGPRYYRLDEGLQVCLAAQSCLGYTNRQIAVCRPLQQAAEEVLEVVLGGDE